jgi:hypothetical protein
MAHWWNYIDGGGWGEKRSEIDLPQCHLVHHTCQMEDVALGQVFSLALRVAFIIHE